MQRDERRVNIAQSHIQVAVKQFYRYLPTYRPTCTSQIWTRTIML